LRYNEIKYYPGLYKYESLNQVSTYNEKILLSQIARGDEKAFRTIFDMYYNTIYNQALFLTKDPGLAEDTVQDIFIKIWEQRNSIGKIDNLGAYINILTRNHILNYFRKIAYQEEFIRQTLAAKEERELDTHDPILLNDLEETIERAFSKLSSQQKRVFELSRSEGLKHGEIAIRLNISKETVKKHISLALRLLKTQLVAYKHFFLFIFLLSASGLS